MGRTGFRGITIPDALYDELEQFVKDSRGYYVTVAEVLREALRDYLRGKR